MIAIKNIERGGVDPRVSTMDAIERAFNGSPALLGLPACATRRAWRCDRRNSSCARPAGRHREPPRSPRGRPRAAVSLPAGTLRPPAVSLAPARCLGQSRAKHLRPGMSPPMVAAASRSAQPAIYPAPVRRACGFRSAWPSARRARRSSRQRGWRLTGGISFSPQAIQDRD